MKRSEEAACPPPAEPACGDRGEAMPRSRKNKDVMIVGRKREGESDAAEKSS
jgi:hypothetical protein